MLARRLYKIVKFYGNLNLERCKHAQLLDDLKMKNLLKQIGFDTAEQEPEKRSVPSAFPLPSRTESNNSLIKHISRQPWGSPLRLFNY